MIMIKSVMMHEVGQTCQDTPPGTNIFKQMQDADCVWPRKPGPIVIESREMHPSSHLEREMGNPKANPRHVRDVEKPDYIVETMVWPVSAVKEELVAPFAVGGVTAFFIAPAIEAGAATTAMLLTGYALGGLVFYYQRKAIQEGKTQKDQMRIDAMKKATRAARPAKIILEPYDTSKTTAIIPPVNVSASTDEQRRLDGSKIILQQDVRGGMRNADTNVNQLLSSGWGFSTEVY